MACKKDQFDVFILPKGFEAEGLSPLAVIVYARLLWLSRKGAASATCGHKWFMEHFNSSYRSTVRAIKELEQGGFVSVERGTGKFSKYTLNLGKFNQPERNPGQSPQEPYANMAHTCAKNETSANMAHEDKMSAYANMAHTCANMAHTCANMALATKVDLKVDHKVDPIVAVGDRARARACETTTPTEGVDLQSQEIQEEAEQADPSMPDTRGEPIIFTFGSAKPPRMSPAPQSQNLPINTPGTEIFPSFDEVLAAMQETAEREIIPRHPYFAQHIDIGASASRFLEYFSNCPAKLAGSNWRRRAASWLHGDVNRIINKIDRPNEHGPQQPAFRNKRTPLTWEEHRNNAMENAQYILSQRGGDAEQTQPRINQSM